MGGDIAVPVGRATVLARVAKHAELGGGDVCGLHNLLADAVGVVVEYKLNRLARLPICHSVKQNAGLDVCLPLAAGWVVWLAVVDPPFFCGVRASARSVLAWTAIGPVVRIGVR